MPVRPLVVAPCALALETGEISAHNANSVSVRKIVRLIRFSNMGADRVVIRIHRRAYGVVSVVRMGNDIVTSEPCPAWFREEKSTRFCRKSGDVFVAAGAQMFRHKSRIFFDAHAANPIPRIESVYLFCMRRMAGVTTPRRLTPAPFAESITAMIFCWYGIRPSAEYCQQNRLRGGIEAGWGAEECCCRLSADSAARLHRRTQQRAS